ncbi:unnamed protein product [Protopolystoma xenopodis]|uniref:Uncharacterized protein n=1 Tax=Protopolystoma xenopodis TaxID=117903 RepID=A0A448X181_9PLAT|nr:unnamed protein product [Protopolystoma xenopodis]
MPIKCPYFSQLTKEVIAQWCHRMTFEEIAISGGCRCPGGEPPRISDLELDIFLNHVLSADQPAVVMVIDSRSVAL